MSCCSLPLSLDIQRYCPVVPLFTLFLYSTVPLCRRKHLRRQNLKIVSIVNICCQRVRDHLRLRKRLYQLSLVHAAHSTNVRLFTSVLWTNLGKTHKALELGRLASFAITVTICLLWTIPMAFFASLSSVEGLKEQFSWIEDAIEAAPFLEPLLEQLAPLFVVVFNSLVSVFVSTCIFVLVHRLLTL
jgi:hypothetical protein